MTSDSPPFRIRDLTLTVFVPTTLFGIGNGAIAPLIALTARELGASFSVASMVVALLGIGRIVGDVPAGWLVSRLGERHTLIGGSVFAVAGALACALATHVVILAIGVFTIGLAIAAWGLARMAYVMDVTPFPLRGRALSTLGGTARIGLFVGPFIGAGAVFLVGSRGGYWVQIVAAVLAGIMMLRLPDVASSRAKPPGGHGSLVQVFRENFAVLRTLGVSMILVGAGRSSRIVVLPLWADHVGLDATTISIIFGISGAMETVLFYPAGKLIDMKGRRFAAVPAMLVLGIGIMAVPLASGPLSMAAVAMIIGTGNGLSAGLVMTLGADVSPSKDRATFIGFWRLFQDWGQAGGPVLIGAVGAVATATIAIASMGALCLVGALSLFVWIPRFQTNRDTDESVDEPIDGRDKAD